MLSLINLFKKKRDGVIFKIKGGGVTLKVKRGETSWAYFPIAYAILLAISLTIIQVLELESVWKIILILLDSLLLFILCFYNGWFRNKIVGVFSKSKQFEEKS